MGEILQQRFQHNAEVRIDDYLEVDELKTASLFRQAARIGAHLAGAAEEIVDAMYRVLYEHVPVKTAMAKLVRRPPGAELEFRFDQMTHTLISNHIFPYLLVVLFQQMQHKLYEALLFGF